jgi:hypothetical protein
MNTLNLENAEQRFLLQNNAANGMLTICSENKCLSRILNQFTIHLGVSIKALSEPSWN